MKLKCRLFGHKEVTVPILPARDFVYTTESLDDGSIQEHVGKIIDNNLICARCAADLGRAPSTLVGVVISPRSKMVGSIPMRVVGQMLNEGFYSITESTDDR